MPEVKVSGNGTVINVQRLAIVVIAVAGLAYLTFLAMTWQAIQADRATRNVKVDALLDKVGAKLDGPERIFVAGTDDESVNGEQRNTDS